VGKAKGGKGSGEWVSAASLLVRESCGSGPLSALELFWARR
jgi:hypothetical protein